MAAMRTVSVATVQLSPPALGQVDANLDALRQAAAALHQHAGKLDLVVLPEMISTGYRFTEASTVHALAEPASSNIKLESPALCFGADMARQLNAYVVIGFPERVQAGQDEQPPRINGHHQHCHISSPHDARGIIDKASEGGSTESRPAHYFNSAALFDRNGHLIHTARKHFLYEDDKVWAEEGPGFQYIDLPDIGRICIAICMDINPYEFEAPFEVYELATFCSDNNVDILALSANWLLSPASEDEDDAPSDDEPGWSTIQYWVERCRPLLAEPSLEDDTKDGATGTAAAKRTSRQRTSLIIANRTGTERGVTFAGSSAILQLERAILQKHDQRQARVTLLSALGTRTTGVQIATLTLDNAPASNVNKDTT